MNNLAGMLPLFDYAHLSLTLPPLSLISFSLSSSNKMFSSMGKINWKSILQSKNVSQKNFSQHFSYLLREKLLCFSFNEKKNPMKDVKREYLHLSLIVFFWKQLNMYALSFLWFDSTYFQLNGNDTLQFLTENSIFYLSL